MHTPESVIAAERRWIEVYKANDADGLGALLTADFLYTSPLGEVVDRQNYLDNLRGRTVLMRAVEPSGEIVRMHENVAIVTATWTVDESYRGTRFKGPVRVIRIWVWADGAWQAAAFQVTNVKAKA